MSLVVFPFKNEDPALVAANLATAAGNARVDEVWAIAADPEQSHPVRDLAADISSHHSKPVSVILQERIGAFRPGKGDGLNTAIRLAAEQGRERVHFYDADITNFDDSWIEGAESAMSRGFGVVRHRFPRAATDAMITWMITRPSLALLFPGTFLPRINQPLGGELLLSRPALESLAESSLVGRRSDWGIDTVITFTTAVLGLGLYEHAVPAGKRHSLYGSLAELRDMALECLDAAASLRGRPPPPPGSLHHSDPSGPVPEDLKQLVAYDVDASQTLLSDPWSREEAQLAERIPGLTGMGPDQALGSYLTHLMDADVWRGVVEVLLAEFDLENQAWRSLAFRLWLIRVLAYTSTHATLGYDHALAYLEQTILDYEVHDG